MAARVCGSGQLWDEIEEKQGVRLAGAVAGGAADSVVLILVGDTRLAAGAGAKANINRIAEDAIVRNSERE